MLSQEQNSIDLTLLDPYLDGDKQVEANLIALLQQAQYIYGYLPKEVLEYISQKSGVALVRLTGIVTFYAQFRLIPPGKYQILICNGTACHVNKSAKIAEAVASAVGAKEKVVSRDGLFCWEQVACLGCCSLSPAMMINGEVYGKLTPEDVIDIINGLREKELEGSEA